MTELIHLLESNINKLIQKLEKLEHENAILKNEIENSKKTQSSQLSEIKSLKEDCESLKLTNALLGGDENKRETKLKINFLIREIDYCIAQLSE